MSNDETLFERPIQVGNKRVFIDLRRNKQGVYLKLSEKGANGNKNTVLIPASGLRKIREVFDDVVASAEEEGALSYSSGGRRKRSSGSGSGGQTRSVYVSGLTWETTWQDLKDHFRQAGEVTHATILSAGGRSLGCGIVEFTNEADAAHALNELNNTELNGRKIHVREDRAAEGGSQVQSPTASSSSHRQVVDMSKKRQKRDNMDVDQGDGSINECNVFCINLSWETTAEDLTAHMSQAGEVVRAEILTNRNGRSVGCGVVEFSNPEEAEEAIRSMNGTDLNGRTIKTRHDYQN